MTVELSCLNVSGEILGSATIEVVARAGALYVRDEASVPIAIAGTLDRTAIFITELDAHVYIEHRPRPEVKAGETLTLRRDGGCLLSCRFA